MKEGLLDTIKSTGYWRTLIRPLSSPRTNLNFASCRDIVEKSSVSIRGWDFPHISNGTNEWGGWERGNTFVENWTEWHGFNEFWRMYRSTQFLAYNALWEDTKPEHHGNPEHKILDVVVAICQISEVLEFCHRLHKNGIYEDGLELSLILKNTVNRRLSTGPRRVPFFDVKDTLATEIVMTRRIDALQLVEEHRTIAVDICLELFDFFGWNPDLGQIQFDQENFYKKNFR
jgi:hypothetical protein